MHLSITNSNSKITPLMKTSSVLMRHYSRHACAFITCKDAARGASLAPLPTTPQSFRLMILQGATLTRSFASLHACMLPQNFCTYVAHMSAHNNSCSRAAQTFCLRFLELSCYLRIGLVTSRPTSSRAGCCCVVCVLCFCGIVLGIASTDTPHAAAGSVVSCTHYGPLPA